MSSQILLNQPKTVEPIKHSKNLVFSVHLQAEKAGRRRGEKETRGRGKRTSKAGTRTKRKREKKAGGEETAAGASSEDERDRRAEKEK